MSSPLLVVVGAGPGVGLSVARRFARDGYDAALIGLDRAVVDGLVEEVSALGVRATGAVAEVTDAQALREAVDRAGRDAGRIDVLHFNPSAFRQEDPLTLTVEGLLEDVALGVGGLLTAVQAARPHLSAGGRVLVTGSMAADQPWHQAASLGVQKAGVRNLVHSLDATLRDHGIRAVSVTVRGTLAKEGPFAPDRVAEALHAASRQDEADWRTEVPYSG